MKIPAISCSFIPYNRNNKYQSQPKNLSFQAVSVKKLKSMPLEKRLTHLFTTMSAQDIVAIGKNSKEIFDGLKQAIKGYDCVIKRILFLKDKEIKNPLLFSSDDQTGNIQCYNMGQQPVIVDSNDDIEQLLPNCGIDVFEGDIICGEDVRIPIEVTADFSEYIGKTKDMEIVLNAENYVNEVFDLTPTQQKWIDKANVESVETVLKTMSGESTSKEKKITFKDVAGIDSLIETLSEDILLPIQFAKEHKEQDMEVNKGFIFYGKPGTGKTLVAEALAGEADANIYKISASELESEYYGKTERAWRDLFAQARANQPSIILIDEMDSSMRERGQGVNNQHRDGIVNQILSLMSQLEKSDDQVFVIGTTNKLETLDKAIVRSGRFGKQIEFKVPDKNGLREIWNQKTSKKKIDPKFDVEPYLELFVRREFTGADIKHLVNEAQRKSWRRMSVYEKMKTKTLTPEYMKGVYIKAEDVDSVLKEMDQMNKKQAKRIGY